MKALISTKAQRDELWLRQNIDQVAKDYRELSKEQSKNSPNLFLIEDIEARLKNLTDEQKKLIEKRLRQIRAKEFSKEARATRS